MNEIDPFFFNIFEEWPTEEIFNKTNKNNDKTNKKYRMFINACEYGNLKSKYMLNKKWYCRTCNNNKNYTLAGKTCHLKTKKHHDAISDMLKDYVERHS